MVSSKVPPWRHQVTVAKHMEMSAEDIAAALAYGCRRLVEQEWERELVGPIKLVKSMGVKPPGDIHKKGLDNVG